MQHVLTLELMLAGLFLCTLAVLLPLVRWAVLKRDWRSLALLILAFCAWQFAQAHYRLLKKK